MHFFGCRFDHFSLQKIFRTVGATLTHDQFLAGFLQIFASLPTPLVPNTNSQSMHWQVVHHAVMLPAGEMRFQQKPVHFCDCKEEGKHMVRPPLNCPHNLNTNRTASLCIVIIDRMGNWEVVVYHLWILEHHGCHDTTFLPITSCLLSAMPGIHPICRHK